MTCDSSWPAVPFPDVIDFREGPGIMARDFREAGTPLIRLAGLTGIDLLAGCNYLDPEMVSEKWSHFALEEGDILLSTSASLGRTARVPASAVGAIPYTGLIRMRPRDERVLPQYVEYLLADPSFQSQIEAMGAGSVMRHFGPSHLRKMTVRVPPCDEQRRIAGVLAALDEKIEHNLRLWRARLDLADTFYGVALGRARDGGCLLHDLYAVGLSGVWGSDTRTDKETVATSCLRGRDLEDFLEGKPMETPIRFISERQMSSRTFADGEIWTAGSGTLGPTLLISSATARRWPHRITYSNFVKRLVPTGASTQASQAWLQLVRAWKAGEFELFRTGTAMPNLDAQALLAGISVPTLQSSDQALLDQLVRAATDPALLAENDTLSAIRDTLLPKLVSGAIRVPDRNDPDGVLGAVSEASGMAV
jgi:type I restriction enzyme, S subunit